MPYEWLYSQTRITQRNSQKVFEILKHSGNKQNSFEYIKVIGTNGKGSTCAMLENALKDQLNLGVFTSPHLIDFEERIRINGKKISSDITKNWVEDHKNLQAAFFELAFLMAIDIFFENKVDLAIIEAGVGAKNDVTAALQDPKAVLITNVDLDHTNVLGETIEEIALDKAAAITANSPIFTTAKNEALDIIEKIAQEKSSKLYSPKTHPELFYLSEQEKSQIFLKGIHQQENASLAVAFLRHFAFDYKKALMAKHFGRMENFFINNKTIILDGAHNPHAAKSLFLSLKNEQIDTIIFGGLAKKDTDNTIKNLLPLNTELIFTAPNNDSTDPFLLAKKYNGMAFYQPKEALFYAIHSPEISKILITGSLYLVGQIRNILMNEL